MISPIAGAGEDGQKKARSTFRPARQGTKADSGSFPFAGEEVRR